VRGATQLQVIDGCSKAARAPSVVALPCGCLACSPKRTGRRDCVRHCDRCCERATDCLAPGQARGPAVTPRQDYSSAKRESPSRQMGADQRSLLGDCESRARRGRRRRPAPVPSHGLAPARRPALLSFVLSVDEISHDDGTARTREAGGAPLPLAKLGTVPTRWSDCKSCFLAGHGCFVVERTLPRPAGPAVALRRSRSSAGRPERSAFAGPCW
jgi:hypothetical protein